MPQQDKINQSKGGRPEHEATIERQSAVVSLASDGVPQEQIAHILGISLNTLKRHYAPELSYSKEMLNSLVKGRLFKKAMEGDTTALIFWAKSQMGWRDRPDPFAMEPDATVIEGTATEVDPRVMARKIIHFLTLQSHGSYNENEEAKE